MAKQRHGHGKRPKERALRVTLTLRPATLRGVRQLADANYATLSGYVDGLLRERLARRTVTAVA